MYKDLKSGNLSPQEKGLVNALVLLSNKISVAEGWDGKVYPGMVEDAVYSLVRSRKSVFLEEYDKGHKMAWNRVYTEMPRFKKVSGEILSLFGGRLKGNTKEKNHIGTGIAQLIRSEREEPGKDVARRVKGVLRNIEGTKIRFLKKKRAYRKGAPPKIPKRILTQKEKTYIKLAMEEALKGEKTLSALLTEVGMEEAMRKKDFDIHVYLTAMELGGTKWTSEKKDRAFSEDHQIYIEKEGESQKGPKDSKDPKENSKETSEKGFFFEVPRISDRVQGPRRYRCYWKTSC